MCKLNNLFSAYLYFDDSMNYTLCKRVMVCMETWKQCTLVLAATDEWFIKKCVPDWSATAETYDFPTKTLSHWQPFHSYQTRTGKEWHDLRLKFYVWTFGLNWLSLLINMKSGDIGKIFCWSFKRTPFGWIVVWLTAWLINWLVGLAYFHNDQDQEDILE